MGFYHDLRTHKNGLTSLIDLGFGESSATEGPHNERGNSCRLQNRDETFWGLTRFGFPDSGNCQFVSQVAMRFCPDVRFSLAVYRIREGGRGVWPVESIDAPTTSPQITG